MSEAMMIPAQLSPALSPGQAGRAQQMKMPSQVPTGNRVEGWNSSNWPTSLGRISMGTSPFGRSVDMVDMATQLMEAGRGALTMMVSWNHAFGDSSKIKIELAT